MAISVSCKCGKQMKVKDELAGKAVRCPGCKGPLRIPGQAVGAGVSSGKKPSTGGSSAPQVDEREALMKFQEAQKKKQVSAEEEAAYRAEQNKLIESYDQLTGRAGPGAKEEKKKGQLTEMKPRKATIFTKIADAFGAMFGTFAFKYVFIALVLGGGVVGSVYLVKFVTSYMHEETGPQMKNTDRARLLLKEAREDVAQKRWEIARDKLDEIIRLDKTLQINRDYKKMREQVDQALAKPSP
jgi:hypothetical protein